MGSDDKEEGSMSSVLSALLTVLRVRVIDEVGRFFFAAHAAANVGVASGGREDREV